MQAAAAHSHKQAATDTLPSPLYCQLLKIFEIFFVFSLPFVIAHHLHYWTPVVSVLMSIGFFGLDQVGVELEGPFGVDSNDFPLLTMGLSMCTDLDAIVRTCNRKRMQARLSPFAKAEGKMIVQSVDRTLGWPMEEEMERREMVRQEESMRDQAPVGGDRVVAFEGSNGPSPREI